jgi:RNA polymerase sigma-70 factor, ECF subfamily
MILLCSSEGHRDCGLIIPVSESIWFPLEHPSLLQAQTDRKSRQGCVNFLCAEIVERRCCAAPFGLAQSLSGKTMEGPEPAVVTGLLKAWTGGDQAALDRLIPLVYDELRRMARKRMRKERARQHAADNGFSQRGLSSAGGRRQCGLATSGSVLRHLLSNHAAHSGRYGAGPGFRMRGGAAEKVNVDDVALLSPEPGESLVALDVGLDAFAKVAPRQAKVLEMRYFGGLSEADIASVLKMSTRTIERDFQFARTWLMREFSKL